MNKEHTSFITGLLSNPNLSSAQRDKVVELALRDLSKNGSEKRILQDLEFIKGKIGIKSRNEFEEDNGISSNGMSLREGCGEVDEIDGSSTKDNKELNQNMITGWSLPPLNKEQKNSFKEYLNEKDYKQLIDHSDYISKVNQVITGDKTSGYQQRVSSLPTYINPAPLSKFLIAYNQDPILKYTCHEIDDIEIIKEINALCKTEQYDLLKHQELIHKSYKNLVQDHFAHSSIKNLILVYLTGDSFTGNIKTWSTENIKINWNSSELLEWVKKNPGVVPNPGENLINKIKNRGFKFNKGISSELSGERITSFSGLVIHFKHLFHIKGDNPLKTMIKRINEKEDWTEKINFQIEHKDFWDNLELFTDVDRLIQSYRKIIKIILEAVEKFNLDKPEIHLIFKEEDNNVIFSIHHQNTYYRKTINNSLERIGDLQTELIKKQINGLSDLYLKADFGHSQFAEINLWDGNPREKKILNKFHGVQYTLKFKK
ncbi:hypothetical protein FK178_02745 [Antarcticibacterium arcticum]|uniref:Histidine Kinase domain-containing protein n=1 Tax=Antarcticibacterium arcticum TaxID=2585771 RepID=A0A5B8YIN3_9FLAO|nr:hypothetical protein [Antarcticibacterium arcticum]QED36697.1 hypothetical protein FK178_02745 [Antarcticibacterium arcticum]